MNRREFLHVAAAGAAVSMPLATIGRAFADAAPQRPAPEIETRSLDELHREALAEGGKLVVYAGGDVPDASAGLEAMFKQRFPGIEARIVTDLSKYHGPRIDLQLARGRLEVDVAHLQTPQDFECWKAGGQLLAYRPRGWGAIYPEYQDPDGAFVAISVVA